MVAEVMSGVWVNHHGGIQWLAEEGMANEENRKQVVVREEKERRTTYVFPWGGGMDTGHHQGMNKWSPSLRIPALVWPS